MMMKAVVTFGASAPLILTDNEPAARSIWDTSPHNPQISSLAALSTIRSWLEGSDDRRVVMSWCPSHVGVKENEAVDRVTHAKGLEEPRPLRSFVQEQKTKWDTKIRSPRGLGR
ncbi:hypothetical protein AX15_004072 [Amanita polypyramis BW_CC]|nr:hypothetical protein AX15_004072 [Amanita polypyramis BW_CC]